MNHTQTRPAHSIDVAEIVRALTLLHPAGSVFEIRGLNISQGNSREETFSGYYVDAALAADHVSHVAYDHGGWYVTLQTLTPDVYARSTSDRLQRGAKTTTSDRDVVAYQWLPIDVDPYRAGGVSGVMATEPERNASASVATEIVDELEQMGWGRPVIGDSGNGRHLLYRVELPASAAGIVKSALEAIAYRHDVSGRVTVDQKVFNPARIWRLYGSKNCKGSDCPRLGRVHRAASILERPDELITISREQLLALVDLWGAKTPQPVTRPTSAARSETAGLAWTPADVETWITAKLGIGFTTVRDDREGLTRFKLDTCPSCASHDASYAPAIVLHDNGRLGYSCFGNSCSGIGWKELRERFDPKTERPAMAIDKQAPPHGSVDHQTTSNTETEPTRRPTLQIRPVRTLVTEHPAMRTPVIDGLLREGETMNLISAPKAGKSWLTIDLALSVATGRPWLGFSTAQGDVLIIDNELHAETTANRIPRVGEARDLEYGAYADRVQVANVRGDGFTINDLPGLTAEFEPGRFKLIILDAWYRFFAPGADENASADIGKMYTILDGISARLGCAFACVHHLSKGNQAGKSVTDAGSGSGTQSRAADTHLVLRQHTDPDVLVLEAVTRSFPGPAPLCLRRRWPVFSIDTQADPKDLHNPAKRSKKGDKEEVVTQNFKTFTEECIGTLPEPTGTILAKAVEAGYSPTAAKSFLKQSVGARLVREMQNPSCKREKLYCRS